MTYHTDLEVEEDLVRHLKEVNAVLQDPSTSVITRYAGVAELGLIRDVRKVEVLTIGLLDVNAQVRSLAAGILSQSYKLGETANDVVALLDQDGKLLQTLLYRQDSDLFNALISKLINLLRYPRADHVRNELIDYGRRHVLQVLIGLGHWTRRVQAKDDTKTIHPLKSLLEAEGNSEILKYIPLCLESDDVYCRRPAILAIGELNLTFNFDTSALQTIRATIDNARDANNYLVTRDGLKALTSIGLQDPAQRAEVTRLIQDIFRNRTYSGPDGEASVFYTRSGCLTALTRLGDYQAVQACIRHGEHQNVRMMYRDRQPKAASFLKRTAIESLLSLYQSEPADAGTLTGRQREILEQISRWMRSEDGIVRGSAVTFLSRLNNKLQALAYLRDAIEANNQTVSSLVANLEAGRVLANLRDNQYRQLDDLLKERVQQLGTISTLLAQLRDEETNLLTVWGQVADVLRSWSVQRITKGPVEMAASKEARLESLWMLYDSTFSHDGAYDTTGEVGHFGAETLQELIQRDGGDAGFRAVLELIYARSLGSLAFCEQLQRVAQSKDTDLVRVCAEMELIIQTNDPEATLSNLVVDFLPRSLGTANGIHPRLASRFIKVLAGMRSPSSTRLVLNLIQRGYQSVRVQLRDALDPYQCYQIRDELIQMLLADLARSYKDATQLRLNYLNLLRAGIYQSPKTSKQPLSELRKFRPEDEQRVLGGLKAIGESFVEEPLPVIDRQHDILLAAAPSAETIDTILFATHDPISGGSTARVYHRVQRLPHTLIYLDRELPDSEILRGIEAQWRASAHQVQHAGRSAERPTLTLAARVEQITDTGMQVDIGLRDYHPFVSAEDALGNRAISIAEWRKMSDNLAGAVIALRLVEFRRDHGQIAFTLRHSDLTHNTRVPAAGTTVTATVKAISSGEQGSGVIFDLDGADVLVPLDELSWRDLPGWFKTKWYTDFAQLIGKRYELTYVEGSWSLRRTAPTVECFAQLLYTCGSKPFELVFVGKTSQGYVFEHQAGKNCVVPAERLIRRRAGAILEFALPDSNLEPGDVLTVKFEEHMLHDAREVLLVIQGELVKHSGGVLRPNMRVVGRIEQIQGRRARLVPSEPEVLQDEPYRDFYFTITDLPASDLSLEIRDGGIVSGRVSRVGQHSSTVQLRYAPARPDKLRTDRPYLCSVIAPPGDDEPYVWLRYANVRGRLMLSRSSYNHLPNLWSSDQRVPVYLLRQAAWREIYNHVATLKQPDQTLAELDLERRRTISGDVISVQQQEIVAENTDGRIFHLLLRDLNFQGAPPRINVGNKVEISYDPDRGLRLKVSQASIDFTTLPAIRNPNTWQQYHDALPSDKEVRYVFVDQNSDRFGGYYILELAPGRLTKLPFDAFELEPEDQRVPLPWELTTGGLVRQRLTDGSEIEHQLAPGDNLLLRRDDNGPVHLILYAPGPLHYAARPRHFNPRITETALPIAGVISRQTVNNGVMIELRFVEDTSRRIKLRMGISGYFPESRMRGELRERYFKGQLQPDTWVYVRLEQAPHLHDQEDNGLRQLRLRFSEVWLPHVVRQTAPVKPEPPIDSTGASSDETAAAEQTDTTVAVVGDMQPSPATTSVESQLTGEVVTGQAPALEAPILSEDATRPQPQYIPLNEKLAELAALVEENPHEFEGKVLRYHPDRRAFQVALDWLNGYTGYQCWLLDSRVSYSLVQEYQSIAAFSENLRRVFTILDIDEEAATIEVSLIDNARLDIDEVAARLDWSDGRKIEINRATYLGHKTVEQVPETVAPSEGQDQTASAAPRSIAAIEITPGVLVQLPLDRVTSEGLPLSRDKQRQLQLGDQIQFRVVETDRGIGIDLIRVQPALLNVLVSSRRLLHGRVVGPEGGRVGVILKGYGTISAILDPDQEFDLDQLKTHDLFRARRRQGHDLCLVPVWPSGLKGNEVVRVTYQQTLDERLVVTFGNNRIGHIKAQDISYRNSFTLDDLKLQPGDEFDAAVIRSVSERDVVPFKMKDMPARGLEYFLSKDVQERHGHSFNVVIVRQEPEALVFELAPGILVRAPHGRIVFDGELRVAYQDSLVNLLPGDLLQLQLQFPEARHVQLQIKGISKSLFHYIRPNTLVQARLEGRPRPREWQFQLTRYNNQPAVLAPTRDLISFIPGVLGKDYQLVVAELPKDPSAPIPVRLRTQQDRMTIVRVESLSVDSIQVITEEGRLVRVLSRDATYRIDHRSSYLRQHLQTGLVLIATWDTFREGNKATFLSLLANDPLPLTFFEGRGQTEWEFTFVRDDRDRVIFEVLPGQLVIVPFSLIYFHDIRLSEIDRFFTGDVFYVTLERDANDRQEGFRVIVRAIELSAIHELQPDELIEGVVADILPDARGISVMILNRMELFLDQAHLLQPSSAYDRGRSIWLRVERGGPPIRLPELWEVPIRDFASFVRAGQRRRSDAIIANLLIAGMERNRIIVEAFDQKFNVYADDLIWSNGDHGQVSLDDLLTEKPDHLWVALHPKADGTFTPDAKLLWLKQIRRFYKGQVVQARVIKVVEDQRDDDVVVLLDLDGRATTVSQRDLILGAPLGRRAIEAGAWVTVRIMQAESVFEDRKRRFIRVSGRSDSDFLQTVSIGERFIAIVRYTLPHGLVFSYEGTLGYVPNGLMDWSQDAQAGELFRPDDRIEVYVAGPTDQRHPFRLVDPSQSDGLAEGDQISGEVIARSSRGVYIRAQRLLTFIDYTSNSERLEVGSKVQLQVEDVDQQRLVATLRLLMSEGGQEDRDAVALDGSAESLERYYWPALRLFQSQLADFRNRIELQLREKQSDAQESRARPLSIEVSTQLSPEQRFVQIVKNNKISCTLRNIRWVIGLLSRQSYVRALLQRLAQYRPRQDDDDMVYVLCEVAQVAAGGAPSQSRPRLIAQSSFAIGLYALTEGSTLTKQDALDYLLKAYHSQRQCDVQLALLCLYEDLGAYDQRRCLLGQIVERLARNMHVLVPLPQPLGFDETLYGPGATEAAKDLGEAANKLRAGKIQEAEKLLEKHRTRGYIEVYINLALCHVLQGAYEHAMDNLSKTKTILSRDRNRQQFDQARAVASQLAVFLYYRLGRFTRLQAEIEDAFTRRSSWIHVWLGYQFYASGHWKLSRELALKQQRQVSVEQLVLASYWEDADQASPKPLQALQALRHALLQTETDWSDMTPQVRVVPDMQEMKFPDLVQAAQRYNIPHYALDRYFEERDLRSWAGSPLVADGLIDLALRAGRIDLARQVALQHFKIRNKRHLEAPDLVAKLYYNLLLGSELEQFLNQENLNRDRNTIKDNLVAITIHKQLRGTPPVVPSIEEFPATVIRDHVARWMKMSAHPEIAVQRLAVLLRASPNLHRIYWTRPDLREELWQVFDRSLDYSTTIELLPDTLPLDSIEDVTFRFLRAGLPRVTQDFIRRFSAQFADRSPEQTYLMALGNLCDDDQPGVHRELIPYLLPRLAERRGALYICATQRAIGQRVLRVLSQHSDPVRRMDALLLLGELLEMDGLRAQAVEAYTEATGLAVGDARRLQATLRILRLHITDPSVTLPKTFPAMFDDLHVDQRPVGDLLRWLAGMASTYTDRVHHQQLAAAIQRLQFVLETPITHAPNNRLQIATCLTIIAQLPSAEHGTLCMYHLLVGTEPNTALRLDQAAELIALFVDYALAGGHEQIFGPRLQDLLEATEIRYEQQKGPRHEKDLTEARRQKEQFRALLYWLKPHALASNPEQIEANALHVLRFVIDHGQASLPRIYRETERLMAILDLSNSHYGSAARTLIGRALLARGNWSQAHSVAKVIADPEQRTALLLRIAADRLTKGETAKALDIVQGLPPTDQLNTFITICKQMDAGDASEAQTPQDIENIIKLFGRPGFWAVGYAYLSRYLSAAAGTAKLDHWIQYLRFALQSGAAPAEIRRILETSQTSRPNISRLLKPADLTRYMMGQAQGDDDILAVLRAIIEQQLCENDEWTVKELVAARHHDEM